MTPLIAQRALQVAAEELAKVAEVERHVSRFAGFVRWYPVDSDAA